MIKRKLLSGNYEPAREASIEIEEEKETSLKEFQRTLLNSGKLGGSFAMVMPKEDGKLIEPATRDDEQK